MNTPTEKLAAWDEAKGEWDNERGLVDDDAHEELYDLLVGVASDGAPPRTDDVDDDQHEEAA